MDNLPFHKRISQLNEEFTTLKASFVDLAHELYFSTDLKSLHILLTAKAYLAFMAWFYDTRQSLPGGDPLVCGHKASVAGVKNTSHEAWRLPVTDEK